MIGSSADTRTSLHVFDLPPLQAARQNSDFVDKGANRKTFWYVHAMSSETFSMRSPKCGVTDQLIPCGDSMGIYTGNKA